MSFLTEGVMVQVVIVIGSLLSAFVGYVVWALKDKKRIREKEEDYRKQQKQTDDEREERIRKERAEQTDKVIQHLDKLDRKIDDLYDYQENNAEALGLIFESDIIQFEAFRKSGLLNGESEVQEKKLRDFMSRSVSSKFDPSARKRRSSNQNKEAT